MGIIAITRVYTAVLRKEFECCTNRILTLKLLHFTNLRSVISAADIFTSVALYKMHPSTAWCILDTEAVNCKLYVIRSDLTVGSRSRHCTLPRSVSDTLSSNAKSNINMQQVNWRENTGCLL